ncbi:MAG: tRNA epoxyqueuosine(34) reductase QueG [Muribaculaceae bacterium]
MDIKEAIREAIMSAGAEAVGFAKASRIPDAVAQQYESWIGEGRHAGMDYLRRHAELCIDPRALLEDAATVVSVAFSYVPTRRRDPGLPVVACYAYGEDYHDVIRRRLGEAVETMKSRFGGSWRICVDSAPIAERYWAMAAGIGKRGKNGSIIVKNCGSMCFLAEVLTSHSVAPDEPSSAVCLECGACVRACPTGALGKDGLIDSRRCLNYLSIEHRGDWEGEMLEAMQTKEGRATLFGCDICQNVCPHNIDIKPTDIEEFHPRERILTLTASDVIEMDQKEFSSTFKGSPIKRAKLEGLRRNAHNVPIPSTAGDMPIYPMMPVSPKEGHSSMAELP